MDKSYRVVWWWWWGGGPCDFSVSPWSKSFFFPFLGGLLFNLGACWDRGPDLDLDQGLTINFTNGKSTTLTDWNLSISKATRRKTCFKSFYLYFNLTKIIFN